MVGSPQRDPVLLLSAVNWEFK